jgi:AraC family transcriptional regulator
MTAMERINLALDHVESQLDEHVDVAQLARIAHMGEHHFRRLFATLAGMGLGEYVRRRRMTLAAADVLAGSGSLLDIALRSGYANADSFARAFRDVHGIAPSDARAPGARLVSQSRLTFRLTLEGATRMQYRIVELPARRFVGRATRVPLMHRGPNPDIVAFVESIPIEHTLALKQRNDCEPFGVLAVMDDVDPSFEEGSMLTYLHGVATSSDGAPDEDTLEARAGAWLVLEPEDATDAALQALWPYAFTEWFPSNPWELAPGPSIVAMRRSQDHDEFERELWLPILRRHD